MIEQSMLEEFARVKEAKAEAEQSYNLLRNKILSSLKRGDEVEPGPLSAEIDRYPRWEFTYNKLEKALGVEGFEALKATIGRKMIEALHVVPSRIPRAARGRRAERSTPARVEPHA